MSHQYLIRQILTFISSRKRPADQGPPGQQQDGEKPFKKRWRGKIFYFEKYRW